MNESDKTLQQEPALKDVMQALAGISKRLDSHDSQLEAIRQGIVDNNIRFDKLEGNFHLLRAEVSTLIEEVRHGRKVLV